MSDHNQTSLSIQFPTSAHSTVFDPSPDEVNSHPADNFRRAPASDYAALKLLIKQAGLLEKQPAYYTIKIVSTLGLLAVGLVILATVDNLWWQLGNAAFLALVFAQIAFLGHDSGHRQIFLSTRKNDFVGLSAAFLLGMVRTWWVEKHNEHHVNPNDQGLDPDIDIPIIAFSPEQARSKKGLYRFTVRYQALLFYPILALEGFGLRLAGIHYLIRHKVKYPVLEPALFTAHIIVYLGLVFYFLNPWHGLLFVLVHQLLFGLHMGMVFAPNHKGMPLLEPNCDLDFLRRQVITARNVNGNALNNFMYGGLNYQIEHHLFPSMPRNRLREAQKIVKTFCIQRGVPYVECSPMTSQRDILKSLHEISRTLRP